MNLTHDVFFLGLVRKLGDYQESPPPFLYLVQNMSSFGFNIQRGVNFASGGSGIFNETGFRNFVRLFIFLS